MKIPQLAVRDTTGAEHPAYFNIWRWILPQLTAAERGGRNASPMPTLTVHRTRERMRDAVVFQMEHMHEVPALIFACAQFEQPPGSAAARAGGSVWPAVQNVLLAARALGLGAAPTTLGLSNRAAAREVLGVPETVEAYVLIPVGYPTGKFGPVTRLPVRETVRWDRWS